MTQAPSADPRRWRRRAEARPDEILDAALAEFTAVGFDAARMEDVAKRAGVSKAAIYLYFESKAALLQALVLRAVGPVAARAEAMANAPVPDPEGALRAILGFALTQLSDPRVFAAPKIVLSIAIRFPEIAAFYRAEVIDRARAAIRTIVAAGIAQGQFKPIEPEAAVRLLMGPFLMEGLMRHIFETPPALADASAVLDVVFDGLRARPKEA